MYLYQLGTQDLRVNTQKNINRKLSQTGTEFLKKYSMTQLQNACMINLKYNIACLISSSELFSIQ